MEPDINVKTRDHGPLLVSVPWLLVSISGVFLCLRIYCKFKRKRHLWWDDYVLIWAWLCLLIDCCCLTYTVSLGFGKHFLAINPAVLPSMGLMGMVGGVFAIFAVMYSKTSFAITLLRFSEKKTRSLLWFIIISVHIALGGSALIPWIQCNPVEKNWNFMTPGKCWNPKIFSSYAIAAAAYSGAMDILLALIPWKMMWNLQMKEKIGVATAMSMGVL
jgi:apolipoprotein N-acyltransferase